MKSRNTISLGTIALSIVTCSAVLLVNSFVSAGNTWTGGGGSTNWSDNNNWGGSAPGYGTLTFTIGGTQGTTSVNNSITAMNQLLWTGSSSWTLNNSGGTVLSLFDNGGTQAKIENQSSGLVTINAPITFAANNGTPPNPFGEINAVDGDITFGSGTLTVNGSSVNGIKLFGANRTTTFNTTVSASGKWFGTTAVNTTMAVGGAFTSGDIYVMNGGTLKVNSGGAITSTAIRLGGDFGNTGSQNQTLGGTLQFTNLTGGQNFSSVINTVTGNSSNALLIDSLNTSGTNTLSAASFLDSPLKTQVASGGTLLFQGGSVDIKAQTLTVAGGGNTTINEALSSSSAAGGSLVKTGNGTLVIQSTGNSYTGTNSGSLNANGTQINAGTLAIAGATSLGLAPAGAYNNIQFTGTGALRFDGASITLGNTRNISIASGSAATFDTNGNTAQIDGVLNGSGGSVAKSGNGTLTLTNSNSYTGGTTVNLGTLTLGHATNTLANAGAVTVNGGTLAIGNNSDTVGAVTLSNGNITGTGGTLTGSSYDVSSGVISAILGGSNVALTKNNSGQVNLSGANSYTGLTTINGGKLVVTSTGSLASGNALTVTSSGVADFGNVGQTLGAVSNANPNPSGLDFSATAGTVTLGSLTGGGNTHFASNGTITGGISTGTVNAAGLLTASISGGTVGAGSLSATTVSGGATTVSGLATIGTMSSGIANLNGATSSITTLNGGTVNLGATTALTVSSGTTAGSITGGGSLTKSTGGTLTLQSANSYTGDTTVAQGTLGLANVGAIAGSPNIEIQSGATLDVSAASGFAVGSSQTLKGKGSIFGATTINGTLSPGNSAGKLTFSGGALTLGSASTTSMEIFNPGTEGTQYDSVATGSIVYNGQLNVTFDTGGTFAAGNTFNLFDGTASSDFTGITLLGQYNGSLNTMGSGNWTSGLIGGLYFTFTGANGVLSLSASAVPEPLTAAGVILLASRVLGRRSRVSL